MCKLPLQIFARSRSFDSVTVRTGIPHPLNYSSILDEQLQADTYCFYVHAKSQVNVNVCYYSVCSNVMGHVISLSPSASAQC